MAWEIQAGEVQAQQAVAAAALSKSKKPIVAICLCHVGYWSAEFAEKTYSVLKLMSSPDFDRNILLSRGSPIDVCRNQLVQSMLKDPRFTHIFFIDDDIVFEDIDPNQAIAYLLSCDAPIVSGLYRARKKEGFTYAMWVKSPNYTPENPELIVVTEWTGNYISVDTVGAGILLIKREVFERVPPPWFVWNDMKALPSEDFSFCLKVKEYGYETRVFTEVRGSHISGALKVMCDGTVTTCDV